MVFEGVTDACDGGEACHGISQPPQICSVEELNKYVDQKRVHWKCEYTALEKVSSILANELHNIMPYHSSIVYWKVKNNFLQVLATYPSSQWAVEVLLATKALYGENINRDADGVGIPASREESKDKATKQA